MNGGGCLALRAGALLICMAGAPAWAQEQNGPLAPTDSPQQGPQEQPPSTSQSPGETPAPASEPQETTPPHDSPDEDAEEENATPPQDSPHDDEPYVTRIAAIEFTGNHHTRPDVMLQEIGLRVGQPATATEIDQARQAIMDLGLFEWVTAEVDETPEGEKVVFGVREKFYFLPIPLLNGDPSKRNYSYGMEMRANNLGGLNQTVRVKYENDQSASKDTPLTRSGSVNWLYPRVAGGPYSLELGYSLSQQDLNILDANDNISGKYHRNITTINAGASRWLNISGPSRGWSGGMGVIYEQQAYTFLSGVPGPYRTEQAVSLTANIGWNDVHDHGYYNTGSAYGWTGQLGDRVLGSNFDFTRHLFYYRVYDHITPKININWQLRVGFADGHPFNGDAYSVGGFTTLRGYQTSISGNAIALSNLEYQHQLDKYPSLRGVWFLDVGNAYKRMSDMDPGKLEAGSGLGVRWRIRSLVNVTLSADAAYGFGPQKKVFYLMTSSAF